MNIVSFELTMPNRNSWNGNWSGEDRRFIIIKSLTNKRVNWLLGDELETSFYHNFGDGWGASILVKIINKEEKKLLRKYLKNGFCGYKWMVDNILCYKDTKNDKSS
jgi:hypothetical protein